MKLLIILFVGFCIFSVRCQQKEEKKGSLEKIVNDALNKIQNFINKVLDQTKNMVKEGFKDIRQYTDYVKDLIKASIDIIKEVIEELKQESEAAAKCCKEQEPELEKIRNEVESEISACDSTAFNRLKNILNETNVQLELEKVNKYAEDLGKIVGDCVRDHPFTSLWCVTKRVKNIFSSYLNLTKSIAHSLIETGKVISEIVNEDKTCKTTATEKLGKNLENIERRIKECIAENIPQL